MCGIFAAVSSEKIFDASDYKKFSGATELVSYRGPDSQGLLAMDSTTSQADNNQFNIFLGHRRLSIIDLSADGNQPMQRDDCYIVFNGEIFNYVELRDELKKIGHQFSTGSDTEVILRTYQQYGMKGFTNFNGMWAFVLVDLKNQKVICSRDRFSIKPLYYLQQNGNWYFGSEIKQLLPFLSEKKLQKQLAYQFLQQQLQEHTNETFFEGIKKAGAKHSLIIDLTTGKFNEEKYWDYELNAAVTNESDAIEKFHSLFVDSVKLRLRSDVTVGSLLSGGLDSSAITVLADSFQPGKFESFSVVNDNKKFSEENFVDELVKHNHILNSKLRFQSSQIPEHIDKVLFHQDEPFGSFSIVAQYLMFQQIKNEHDIKVILCGQGGDEIMMGYLKYFFFNLQNYKRNGRWDLIAKEILSSLINRTVLMQLEWNQMKRYLPGFAGKKNDFILLNGETENVWQFHSIVERQQKDIDLYSVPVLTHYEDRNSMAASIESRLPFLDHRLVNFLLSIPLNMKMKNGWTKYILRKSMTELPDSIRWRRDKKGFITPEEIWLKTQLTEMVKNEFTHSLLHEQGIINKEKFLNYYQDFLNGKSNTDYSLIFRTFIFEKWMKQHFNH